MKLISKVGNEVIWFWKTRQNVRRMVYKADDGKEYIHYYGMMVEVKFDRVHGNYETVDAF